MGTKDLPFVRRSNNQQIDDCLAKAANALFGSGDSQQNRDKIGDYLRLCRSHTIKSKEALNPLLKATNSSNKDAKQNSFWICDMIKADCLLMYISQTLSFLIDENLQIFEIVLNEKNNFCKICVDSSSECTILCGSFMNKDAHRMEFLIEDVVCYKSESLVHGKHSLLERLQKIGKLVQNYRALNGKKRPSNFLFDFRGKMWISSNSAKGISNFFNKFYRASKSTSNIMFADGKYAENYSKGHMIWSNLHIPFCDKGEGMFHFVYLPHFFVQIQVPISMRRNHSNYNNQQIGMTNKHGVVQDFNAVNTQQIMMNLRNDDEGIWTVTAIKASFDAGSMQQLMQVSSTNNYRRFVLAQIEYNKQKSYYSLKNILNESKITNIVERDAKKYNQLLIKFGTGSSVHSASDKEKMALLTTSVMEFVKNCTRQIQTCDKKDVVDALMAKFKKKQ